VYHLLDIVVVVVVVSAGTDLGTSVDQIPSGVSST